MTFLVYLFFVIFSNGLGAFRQTEAAPRHLLRPRRRRSRSAPASAMTCRRPTTRRLIRAALKQSFPEVEGRAGDARAHAPGEWQRRVRSAAPRDGESGADRHHRTAVAARQRRRRPAAEGPHRRVLPEAERPLNDQQLAWLDKLQADGALGLKFNKTFLTGGDSREPERAGIWGAVVGSFFTLAADAAAVIPHRRGRPPSTWKNSRTATAGPTSSKSTSTISPRCPPSCSACWAWRYS